jgi:hypothetical protein
MKIPRKLVTFQVMRRTLGTGVQKHGTMKDAQGELRHASIKTTADVYMQEIPEGVRAAIQLSDASDFGETAGSFDKIRKCNASKFQEVGFASA